MNDLNKHTSIRQRKTPVPDILNNLNISQCDDKRRHYEKERVQDALEKKEANVNKIRSSNVTRSNERTNERIQSRKMKKALGYAGWVLCFPLMLAALAIREKPSKDDADDWKDDPCLPWWYDVHFTYPGEDEVEETAG